jgi:hypothetical protein
MLRSRTRGALAQPSVVVDGDGEHTHSPSDPRADVSRWQKIFATFVEEASSALATPYFYLLQSNGWKSLCLLTGLSEEVYSALLLECDLVRFENKSDGTRTVAVRVDAWNNFLMLGNLRGDIKGGRGGCAELSWGKINKTAIERTMGGVEIEMSDSKNMHALRIGKVTPGTRIKCTSINNNKVEPPGMNHAMWVAKRKLCRSAVKLQSIIDESKRADIATIKAWVLMSNIEQHVGSKRKREENYNNIEDNEGHDDDDDDDDDEADDAMQQSTLNILSTPSLPAATVTAPNVSYAAPITPARTASINTLISKEFQDKFPSLFKHCPNVLLRDIHVIKGIDLDKQLFHSLLAESVELCKMLGEPLQYARSNGQYYNHLLQLSIPAPTKKNKDRAVKPNVERCIKELLSLVESVNESDFAQDKNDATKEQIVDILVNYCCDNHITILKEKLRSKKMIPRIMNEYDVAAIIDVARLKIWQWRKIHQGIRYFMDLPKVSVEEKRLRRLGADCGLITHGTYHYSDPANPGKVKELVRYWTKDPVVELLQSLQGMVNGYLLHPADIQYIHVVQSGDHGKNKFRFATKVVVGMNDGTTYSDVFGLADVDCKKDHPIILEETIMPVLVEGINKMHDSEILFYYTTDDDTSDEEATSFSLSLGVKEGDDAHTISIKPNILHAGDLSYLAFIMGKANFSSSWCNWCKCDKESWQTQCAVSPDMLWDVESIIQQAASNESNGYTDTPKMLGVRRSPLTKIPFKNIIFAGLHAGIGIGNRIVAHLEAFIDIDIEHVTPEEFQVRESKANAEQLVAVLRAERNLWSESHTGGRQLDRAKYRIKRIDIELKRTENADDILLKTAERSNLDNVVRTLTDHRTRLTNRISNLDQSIREKREKLKKFTSSRRGGEESVYTIVDRIFQKYGANRSNYFGRAFEGIDIRKLMKFSDELFGTNGEIRAIMLQRARDAETEAKEITICDDVGLALKLWDGAFADIHSIDTSREHCDSTQERINKAMDQLRFMKIPITPKMHGMECHVVDQMRNILGGIGKLMEHWMEHYHQVGYRFDMAYCRAGSLKGQADIRSSAEKRGRNPRVQMCKKMLNERYEGTRKRRKSAIENEEKEIRVKEERRDGALTEITHKIAQRDIMSLEKEIQECEEELDELEDLEDREKLETEIFGEDDGNNE